MWLLTLGLAAEPLQFDPVIHRLDNGLVLVIDEDTRTDKVALHIAFGVGARDEEPGEFGCAHLFEHLMFEGSANVGTNMFDTWLTQAGGSNNAWTSDDMTAYHEAFPSGAFDLALFLESDRIGFLDAGLVEENVANQQLVVLQERAEGYAEPNGRDWDAISRLTHKPDHPYHHPVIGSVADIEGFNLKKVQHFWDKHYRTQNAVLVVVGNVEPKQAIERIEHWFQDVPDRGPAPKRIEQPLPTMPSQTSFQHGMLEDDVEERSLYLIWPSVERHNAREPVYDLLSLILSNGQGTRLDDAVYYKKDLATSVGIYSTMSSLDGRWIAYLRSPDTPLQTLREAMTKSLKKLVKKPPTDEEMKRAVMAIRSSLLRRGHSPERRAEMIADCYFGTGDVECSAKVLGSYDDVSVADVVQLAKELLELEPWTLSVVPRGDKGALEGAQMVEIP